MPRILPRGISPGCVAPGRGPERLFVQPSKWGLVVGDQTPRQPDPTPIPTCNTNQILPLNIHLPVRAGTKSSVGPDNARPIPSILPPVSNNSPQCQHYPRPMFIFSVQCVPSQSTSPPPGCSTTRSKSPQCQHHLPPMFIFSVPCVPSKSTRGPSLKVCHAIEIASPSSTSTRDIVSMATYSICGVGHQVASTAAEHPTIRDECEVSSGTVACLYEQRIVYQ